MRSKTGNNATVNVRSLHDHRAAVAAALGEIRPLEVLLPDAAGATLARDVIAAGRVPALDLAAFDGFAVASADVEAASEDAPITLPLAYEVDPSESSARVHVRGTVAKVRSGSPVPRGATAVVRAEHFSPMHVSIDRQPREGEGIRRAGTDAEGGTVAVPAGRRLGPREIALAAALSHPRLWVRPVPRVVVMPIGSELVEPGSQREGVVDSNGHMLAALVVDAGARAYRVGVIPDDEDVLAAAIEDHVVRADVIVTTGALSTADALPGVLARIGDVDVVDIALSPGGRHAIGSVGGVPVIAMPGHPVSALIAFEAYVRPALRMMSGFVEPHRVTVRAEADARWSSPPGMVHALPVSLDLNDEGAVTARPIGDPDAVGLAAIAESDGLGWVTADVTDVGPGDSLWCTVWDR